MHPEGVPVGHAWLAALDPICESHAQCNSGGKRLQLPILTMIVCAGDGIRVASCPFEVPKEWRGNFLRLLRFFAAKGFEDEDDDEDEGGSFRGFR
jgi:hypothetical protein